MIMYGMICAYKKKQIVNETETINNLTLYKEKLNEPFCLPTAIIMKSYESG